MAKFLEHHGISIAESALAKGRELLEPGACALLLSLHRELDAERQELLTARKLRQKEYDDGVLPAYLNEHKAARGNWQVNPIPADLLERRVEITGPVNNAKMVLNMLSENEQGVVADMAMLDFEDSMKPSWANVIDGVRNVKEVAEGTLTYVKPADAKSPEKVYKLNPKRMAKMMVRVRGLHLEEANVQIDGTPVSGGLLDLALCAYHSAARQLADGKTPKFYVPKCEHYLEARWWHRAFSAVERQLKLPHACLRTTFLIETLPAAFQMEEILFEIRERAAGLNGGRWDKIFSDIKVLRAHGDRVMSDRAHIDMKCPWMDNYAKRLIKICHKHGAFAMGGMSAFTPGRELEVRERQTKKVLEDKAREAEIGHDGCWVSHPYFIGIAREQFRQKNQLDKKLEDFPERPDILPQARDPKSLAGLRTNIRVAIAYQNGWNQDIGCVAFDNLMEDLATLEISRAQTWQWLRHGVKLEDGQVVNPALVEKLFDEEAEKIIREFAQESKAAPGTPAFQDLQNAIHTARDGARALFLEKELRPFFRETSEIAR
jgi:malate synthase